MQTISVTFVHKLTGKPISGIEVNMYEWHDSIGENTKLDKVKFIDSIDKTSVGKINKLALREKYSAQFTNTIALHLLSRL